MDAFPPYLVADEQRMVCPACGSPLKKWPLRRSKCPACGTDVHLFRDDAGVTHLMTEAQDRAARAAVDERRHQQSIELHKVRLRQLQTAIAGATTTDQQVLTLESLLRYAIDLQMPSWPELAAKVERIRIQRDAETSASVNIHYRFVATATSPCATAAAMNGQVGSAADWFFMPTPRQQGCEHCHCCLESYFPEIDAPAVDAFSAAKVRAEVEQHLHLPVLQQAAASNSVPASSPGSEGDAAKTDTPPHKIPSWFQRLFD